jgi:uncharacterized protein YbjT (DUF2867 family)
MKRVLVIGATGQIGREVVAQLGATGCRIRALARNPESTVLPDDVEVVRGDLTDPDTLDGGLADVDAVFLIWVVPFAAAAAAIDRIASRAGRIVFLSSPHRSSHPFFAQPNPLKAVHAGVEQLIESSGREWTFLRPGAFAINCRNWWAPQIADGDVVRWFHADAATAPIHERDIAATAVRALCDEGHAGREYVLTGPASLTQREQLQIIGDAIGRPLRFAEVPAAAARQEVLTMMAPSIADMLLAAYGAAVGRSALVTSTVCDVTGTPARAFRDWAVDHAAEFSQRKIRPTPR